MARTTLGRHVAVAVGIGSLLLAATACSDDSEKDSGGKDSVTVMVMAPETGPATYPGIRIVAEGFAKQINDKGGVNGRNLVVNFCDEAGDPNGATKCARQAVADKVSAVVGSFSPNGANYMPVLEAGKIPYLAGTALSAQDYASPVSFPVIAGPVGFAHAGAETVAQGCKSTRMVAFGSPAAKASIPFFQMGRQSKGAAPAEVTEISPTAVDYSAAAAEIKDDDCVFLAVPEPFIPKFLAAAKQQNLTQRYFAPGGAFNKTVLDQSKDQLQNAITISYFVALKDKAWDGLRSAVDLTKVDVSNVIVQNTWVGMTVFAQVAAKLSQYDGAAVIDALNTTTALETGGLTPPLNFTKELPIPQLKRIFNPNVVSLKVVGTEYEPVDAAGFVNAAQYLKTS